MKDVAKYRLIARLLESKSQIVHEASVVWSLSPPIALTISLSRSLKFALPAALNYLKSIWSKPLYDSGVIQLEVSEPSPTC